MSPMVRTNERDHDPDLAAWEDGLPLVGECLWCPELRFVGTAAEVVVLQHAHRRAQHPLSFRRLKGRSRDKANVLAEVDADRRAYLHGVTRS